LGVEVINPVVTGGDDNPSGGSGGSGGGGGGNTLNNEESERFFQSEEIFELVRGEDQTFAIDITNPYEDAVLRNLVITLEGFSEDYMVYSPTEIDEIGIGESRDIEVEITAPGYFTQGEYQLAFRIEGQVVKNQSNIIPLRYTKDIILYLFEVSRADAITYTTTAREYVEELTQSGYESRELVSLLKDLEAKYNETEFKQVKEIYEKINELYQAAKSSEIGIEELESAINLARDKGIDIKDTERLVYLAKSSLERGNFLEAYERIKEAQLTFAIESGGKYLNEIRYSMKNIIPLATRYVPFTQQKSCCVPASISIVMYKRNIPLLPQELLGYHLGLIIDPQNKELFWNPRTGK